VRRVSFDHTVIHVSDGSARVFEWPDVIEEAMRHVERLGVTIEEGPTARSTAERVSPSASPEA